MIPLDQIMSSIEVEIDEGELELIETREPAELPTGTPRLRTCKQASDS